MAATAATIGRDARTIGLIGGVHFLSHFYYLALPPLFPLIKAELGVSNVELGFALSAYAASTAVLQTPVGMLVDRIGGRWVLIAGLLINAAAITAVGFAPSLWVLAGMLFVAGIGNSVFHPADYAILSTTVDQARLGRAFSLHSFGGTTGFAAAPVVMVALAALWDWRVAVIAVGTVGIALSLVMALLRQALPEHAGRDRATADNKDQAKPGWRALTTRPMIVFFLFYLLLASAGSGLSSFTVLALVEIYGVDLAAANGVLTTFLIMVAVGVLLGGIVADRTTKHDLVLFVTYGVSGACLFVIGTTALQFWMVIGVFAMAGLMRGVVNPTRDMLMRQAAPAGAVGAAFGFVTTGFTLGQTISPLIYGWLMDIGSPAMVFWLAAAFTAAAIALVLIGRERGNPG